MPTGLVGSGAPGEPGFGLGKSHPWRGWGAVAVTGRDRPRWYGIGACLSPPLATPTRNLGCLLIKLPSPATAVGGGGCEGDGVVRPSPAALSAAPAELSVWHTRPYPFACVKTAWALCPPRSERTTLGAGFLHTQGNYRSLEGYTCFWSRQASRIVVSNRSCISVRVC